MKQILQTNFVDDILSDSMGGKRRFNLIPNNDGTYSLEDVTEYDQLGSQFGSANINATNNAVNESADKNKILETMAEINATTEAGYMADALAIKELSNSFTPNNITLDCAISENVIYARKTGNLVRVKHNGTITGTLTVATAVTLCTLPEEFRPKISFTKNIMYRISSDNNLWGYGVLEVVGSSSQTNPGEVLLKPYNVPSTGGMLTFDETFIIT